MTKKSKYAWWALVLVVIVALIVWWIASNHKSATSTSSTTGNQNQTAATNTQTTNAPSTPSTKSVDATYTAAVAKYANSRIQLQQSCQTVPNNVVYKSGTTVMFDNRASIAHTIKLDSASYTIAAYGYKLVTLSNAKLPHTIIMDCDKAQNVATILLEK